MWEFIQNQIFGMKWLHELLSKLIIASGLDTSTRIGDSLVFFLYDTFKISILLCFLIFLISYIQSYFPPERSKKILSHCKGFSARVIAALLGTVTSFVPVLQFLFLWDLRLQGFRLGLPLVF